MHYLVRYLIIKYFYDTLSTILLLIAIQLKQIYY